MWKRLEGLDPWVALSAKVIQSLWSHTLTFTVNNYLKLHSCVDAFSPENPPWKLDITRIQLSQGFPFSRFLLTFHSSFSVPLVFLFISPLYLSFAPRTIIVASKPKGLVKPCDKTATWEGKPHNRAIKIVKENYDLNILTSFFSQLTAVLHNKHFRSVVQNFHRGY